MATPIRRLIQLVLDRLSAKRTEDEAKRTIGNIESRLSGLGRVARAVGGFLATAFGVRALIRFGVEAVKQASAADRVWTNLKGTIEAAGVEFGTVEQRILDVGKAFQASTIHSDDEFFGGLSRMVALTGDVEASLTNMGLAANVASQFFGGDLAPAVELVSKVMQGQLIPLTRLGIKVKDAQEGLEVLARRSFGAAERAAGTFSGKIARLNNTWDEFKEELGDVLVGAEGTAGALDVLIGAVRTMEKWVRDNKDELRRWAKDGIDVAIAGVKTLVGWMRTFLQLRGQMSLAAGSGSVDLSGNVKGLTAQIEGFKRQRKLLEDEREKVVEQMDALAKEPQRIQDLGKFALDLELQSVTDQLKKVEEGLAAAEAKLAAVKAGPPETDPLDKKPVTAKGAKGEPGTKDDKIKSAFEDVTDAQKVLKEFGDRMMQIDQLADLLGDDFDKLGAEADALEDAINGLTGAGVQANDNFLVKFRDRLALIGPGLNDFAENAMLAGSTLADEMDKIALKAQIWGDEFDATGAMIDALGQHLERVGKVMQESDPRFQAYLEWLKKLREGSKKAAEAEAFRGEIASAVAQAASAAMFGELGDVAQAKAKQNTLQALEYYALAAADALFGGGLKVGPILALAKTHTALAALWGAFAAVSGGGGAGGGLSGARGASGDDSRKVDTGPVVYVGFIGPGFRATNPEVQEVWRGTEKIVREKFPNAKRIPAPRGP